MPLESFRKLIFELMMNSAELLKSRNVRPSLQRICILDYLRTERNHPTVNVIYEELLPKIPTLSRTTVYNTLETLRENNLVRTLDFGDGSIHYDADTDPHVHFKCERCGEIYDILAPTDDLQKRVPEGFSVLRTQFYVFGICANCEKNSKCRDLSA